MLPIPITSFLTRGHIDVFQRGDQGQAWLCGWIFREDILIERIDVALQEKPWISSFSLGERLDVKAAYEPIIGACPHAANSGFDITAPLPADVEPGSSVLISVTPYTADSRRLDTLQIYFCAYEEELKKAPQPPTYLQERIGGSKDFIQTAAQLVSLILTCVGKHKRISAINKILDWGCGCGRVIAQMMKLISPERLHGCDIDSEAITWDQKNIHGPRFTRVAPYPPSPYQDGEFDLVYGISVMTHLDEDTQMLWLEELKRITRRGGILALSVIGANLRSKNMPASVTAEFSSNGFASFVPNYSNLLSEFSHKNYYRESYHRLDYILSRWGKYFEILEFVETKHQDIVVLRAQ